MNCTCSDCYEGCDWDCPECGPSAREFLAHKIRSSLSAGLRKVARAPRLRRGVTQASAGSSALSDGAHVVNMNDAIKLLDPDSSQFSVMLTTFGGGGGGGSKIAWLDDEMMPRLTEFHWSQQLWGDWIWFDPWTTESDRRKQWERERDAAIAWAGEWRLVARASFEGRELSARGDYFHVGDIVRNTATGEVMTVKVIDSEWHQFS